MQTLFSRTAKTLLMYYNLKEKSWSVLLIRGYVTNNQVRAERCENCKSTTEVLTLNQGNPNLMLYGCKDSKCKHRMLRLDFDDGASKKIPLNEVASALPCNESVTAYAPVLSSALSGIHCENDP
jgi:hypothetical protein